jgi:cobalt-zinc-cadmium efflux system outer membrane protein
VPTSRQLRSAGLWLLLACAAGGCQSSGTVLIGAAPSAVVHPQGIAAPPSQPMVQPAAYFKQAETRLCPVDVDDFLTAERELEPDQLVAEVLRRNPSLQAMVAAWQAAAQRYPQMVSLEDPMLSLAMGPGTFGDPNHDVAWMIEGSQKIPWCGKRQLRGQQAQAEASAAHWDVDDAELRLVESAKLALLDYYLVRRDLTLNAEGLRLAQGFRETADSHYRNNLVTQQDILQADLELSELRRRQFELERMDRVAAARINTLLHRPADQTLPPPPSRLSEIDGAPSLQVVEQLASERRPDLMALGSRLRAEQAAVAIAQRDYYPDLDVVGRYDGFWQKADRNLAPMVGVNLNVPLDNERRRAAVREAQFRANQRRAEFDAKLDEVQNDVAIAYRQVEESRRTIELFDKSILPVAEQNLASAQSNYTANKIDFLRLIEAARQSVMLREKHEEALADYRRRLAELERASGGPLDGKQAEEISKPSTR